MTQTPTIRYGVLDTFPVIWVNDQAWWYARPPNVAPNDMQSRVWRKTSDDWDAKLIRPDKFKLLFLDLPPLPASNGL
jgi:hypothetical protein